MALQPLETCRILRDSTRKVLKTFGIEDSNKWEPWSYASRLRISKHVENLRQIVNKQNISDKTKQKKNNNLFHQQKSSRISTIDWQFHKQGTCRPSTFKE